ncbi:uncharacterized protein BO80DRAFT_469179 [Aspergillus ibericus CBS 121593]|uniref:Alcohol dehydrogenase-like N-terminal domain-containing protein n=1 Tax=Aspergillus ibericus CBS 121593 TaxID=1448316 RepID=A0A395GKH6_9EURO|nr:hypothetical protein BO80DRAFT_469179 [Aspergillus ibericus CBS 121593]RAK95746.1 hypothetical protein BO80DRAFT_469179 [Aspergillus ibericus CBS 121593]
MSPQQPNQGVYIDPAHNLYIADAEPTLEQVIDGSSLEEGEVTVAIKYSGICGSDVHFWKHGGIGPWVVKDAHILGHESAGVVVKVHPSVTSLAIGDRVAVEPHISTVSWSPADLCESSSGMVAQDRVSHIPARRIGDPVLICGAGPIGLVMLECCRAAGAYPIVISDINPARLEFAQKFVPAARTLLVRADEDDKQFAARVVELMGGEDSEPAIALECTGFPFMRLSEREIDLQFQQRYVNMWPRAIRVLSSGMIDLSRLITHEFAFKDAPKAFETASDPNSGSIKTIQLDGHEILATEIELIDPQRTVYRFKLSPDSHRHTIPKTATSIIIKQQKDDWEEEFEDEEMAYKTLELLQGDVIPYFYGRGYFDGRPALILSDINGINLNDLAHSNDNIPEDSLQAYLEEAFHKLSRQKALYWDQKLDNFLLCNDQGRGDRKVMVVDLEQMEFPSRILPWQHSINEEAPRSLMEQFRDKRNPRRTSSPLALWLSGHDESVSLSEREYLAPVIHPESTTRPASTLA